MPLPPVPACGSASAPDPGRLASPPVAHPAVGAPDALRIGAGAGLAATLGDQAHLCAPDLRGFGGTDRPGTYSLELMCDDVRALPDALDLARATLIGRCVGAVVAYLLAQTCPERVAALVLEEPPPPMPLGFRLPPRPAEPLDYDWAVREAVVAQLNDPDPVWWERMAAITAPTLWSPAAPRATFRRTASTPSPNGSPTVGWSPSTRDTPFTPPAPPSSTPWCGSSSPGSAELRGSEPSLPLCQTGSRTWLGRARRWRRRRAACRPLSWRRRPARRTVRWRRYEAPGRGRARLR
ncbi:alpha/beta fold hydrolase [Micromonospora sp. KC723]|nr:alpha/beta fold hydrolase [Micromonospora sp. KC723]